MKNRALFFLLLSLFLAVHSVSAIQVTSVSPTPQTISASETSDITVSFDTPLDVSTVLPTTFRVFGRWSGPMNGTFQFSNGNQTVTFTPDEPFFLGEWIAVMLSRSITDMSGTPIPKGYNWNFWIRVNPASMTFVKTDQINVRYPGEGHIQTYGAYAGDLNNDGWTDLTVPNEISNDLRIFLNDGSGGYSTFDSVHLIGTGNPSPNEGADFNGDGEIDFVVGGGASAMINVLLGDGTGNLTFDDSLRAAQSVRGIACIDLDGDGDEDIVTANRVGNNLTIFYNDGTGKFPTDTSFEGGSAQETACAAADANNDGILDLFVGALTGRELMILLGDGEGNLNLSDKVSTGAGQPWMIAVGDINNDGNVDVASANSNGNNVSISFGDGLGGLSPTVDYPTGDFVLAIDLGDLDGDGDLDLVSSNYLTVDFTVYENLGNGIMGNRQELPAVGAGSCAILHDRDKDGDMDITGIDEVDDLLFLFDNCSEVVNPPDDSISITDTNVVAGMKVRLDIYASNELPLKEIELPFSYAGDLLLTFDSASNVGLRSEELGSAQLVGFDPGNERMAFVIKAPTSSSSNSLSPGSGVILQVYFTVPFFSLPGENIIELTSFSSFSPSFSTNCAALLPPNIEAGLIKIACCENLTGNVDNDPSDLVDIGDLTALIDFLFISGTTPVCIEEANTDGIAGVDIGDITALIDFLFISGTLPQPCP